MLKRGYTWLNSNISFIISLVLISIIFIILDRVFHISIPIPRLELYIGLAITICATLISSHFLLNTPSAEKRYPQTSILIGMITLNLMIYSMVSMLMSLIIGYSVLENEHSILYIIQVPYILIALYLIINVYYLIRKMTY